MYVQVYIHVYVFIYKWKPYFLSFKEETNDFFNLKKNKDTVATAESVIC